MKPTRVQLSRKKGWRMPPNTVSVSRPHRYGNPFRIGIPGVADAGAAVEHFRRALLAGKVVIKHHKRGVTTTEHIRAELGGKNLACWCPLDQPCHADVLLEIANPD